MCRIEAVLVQREILASRILWGRKYAPTGCSKVWFIRLQAFFLGR